MTASAASRDMIATDGASAVRCRSEKFERMRTEALRRPRSHLGIF
jgi:hypothetical protein